MSPPNKVLLLGGCGHVGSALLRHLLARGLEAESVDLGLRGVPPDLQKHNTLKDYRSLGRRYLSEFSHVVLLAGHSSVQACASAPVNAADSLVIGLRRLWTCLTPQQRLIFASSASVHAPAGQQRLYDKLMRSREELLLAMMPGYALGLRFGTVCGLSANTRDELMLNSMVSSALADKQVRLSNAAARRPVLGMADLLRAVDRILDGHVPYGAAYNLCSFNSTVGEMGDRVAQLRGVPMRRVVDSKTYDFVMENAPVFDGVCEETIDTIVESLVAHYKAAGLVPEKVRA